MRILRSSDYRRMPWKNGGGVTREIAVSPAGATFETLDWRVSLAAVVEDGPFSIFNGMDRTLCVTRGAGIQLQADDSPPTTLHATSAPHSFDGSALTRAQLIDGPIEDLSVMSRRGRFRHSVRRVVVTDPWEFTTRSQSLIVYCQRGELTCIAGSTSEQLHADDSALFDNASGSIRVTTEQTAEILVIEFFQYQAPPG
ncbi:MAG: HutD family protein [Steroidobacter sp.]